MTSAIYSKQNLFGRMFLRGLKQVILPAVLMFLGGAFLIVMPLVSQLADAMHNPDITEDLIYAFYDSSNDFVLIILLGLIAGAVWIAFMLFSFLFKTKKIDFYFSTGIQREKLFAARFLAGAFMSVLPVVLVFAAALVINLLLFGYTGELMSGFLQQLLGLCATVLTVYTLSVLAIGLAGTVIEGFINATVLLLGTYILLSVANTVAKYFLEGNALGVYVNQINDFYVNPSLDQIFWMCIPPLFFQTIAENTCMLYRPEYGMVAGDETPMPYSGTGAYDTFYQNLDFATPLVWLGICVLAAVLAMMLFKRRKAEFSENTGNYKAMKMLVICALSLWAFGIALDILTSITGQLKIALPVAFAALVIAALGIEFYYSKSLKAVLESCRRLPVYLASPVVALVICCTGCFGYSSYVPQSSQVQSAEIIYPGSNDFFTSGIVSENIGNLTANVNITRSFSSPQALEVITDVHRQACDAADGSEITSGFYVNYTLRDGSTVDRYFRNIPMQVLEQLLQLDRSPELTEDRDVFFGVRKAEDDSVMMLTDMTLAMTADTTLNKDRTHVLTDRQRTELFQALKLDYMTMPIDQFLYPETAGETLLILHTYMTPETLEEVYGETVDTLSASSLLGSGLCLYIDESYTNTYAYLQQQGLLVQPVQMESVYVIRVSEENTYYSSMADSYSPFYRSIEYYESYWGDDNLERYQKIEDPKLLAELQAVAKDSCMVSDGGYVLCYMVRSNEETTPDGSETAVYDGAVAAERSDGYFYTKFIKEADAPQALKQMFR